MTWGMVQEQIWKWVVAIVDSMRRTYWLSGNNVVWGTGFQFGYTIDLPIQLRIARHFKEYPMLFIVCTHQFWTVVMPIISRNYWVIYKIDGWSSGWLLTRLGGRYMLALIYSGKRGEFGTIVPGTCNIIVVPPVKQSQSIALQVN